METSCGNLKEQPQICFFFLNNNCKFGSTCKKRHQKECFNFRKNGYCQFGNSCHYFHKLENVKCKETPSDQKQTTISESNKQYVKHHHQKFIQKTQAPDSEIFNFQTFKEQQKIQHQDTILFNDYLKKDIKIICMDISNYAQFFYDQDKWDFQASLNLIKNFAQAAFNSNFKIIGFIADQQSSDEAKQKWITRKEKEFLDESIKKYPQGMSEMLAEMFRECNIEIHFSVIDHNDTIAYYANYYQCILLSRNKHFWRYKPKKYVICQKYTIISDEDSNLKLDIQQFKHNVFPAVDRYLQSKWDEQGNEITPKSEDLSMNRLTILDETQTSNKEEQQNNLLKFYPFINKQSLILEGLPPTNQFPTVSEILTKKQFIKGLGSPYTKEFGNPLQLFQEARQALYYRLGIREDEVIHEIFPVWDNVNHSVKWHEQDVKPIQNDQYLDDPEYSISKLGQICNDMPLRHIMSVRLVAYQISYMADIQKRKLIDYCINMKE